LALTSPTGGGRSVGIVRSRTKAMEFSLWVIRNAHMKTESRHDSSKRQAKVPMFKCRTLCFCAVHFGTIM
jgi:hypothetical protein